MSVSGAKPERRWTAPSGTFASARAAAAALRARIPPAAFAYAVPSLVAAAAVQTWFRGDTVLAGGDAAPPLVTDAEYAAHWNHEDGGEGAPSYTIVSLPYIEGLRAALALGLTESVFQRVWLTLLVVGLAAAVVYLARSLGLPPVGAGVAGFVAVFNAHFLSIGFDWVPFAAMLAAAFLGGIVIRAGSERPPPVLLFALASLLLGLVLANPALVALVLAWLCVSVLLAAALHGRSALSRCAGFLARAAPFVLLFNLWWLVPAVLTISGDVFDERYAAASVDDWSWTHARASIANVVGLTSSWAWPKPEYMPFAAGLEREPLTWLQYLPAVAAVLGVVLSPRSYRGVTLVLATVGAVSIWVMKGVHDPLPATNRWLYDTVPGFWLLRDPAKVGLVLVLVLALLTAIAITRLLAVSGALGGAAAAIVVAGALAFAHPFLTGEIVPDERPLLPSAHVRVPDAWHEAAAFVDDAGAPGKVLVLPRLEYYQAPTTWGYYGASFLHRLFERPVVEIRPGGYYDNRALAELVQSLESDLLSRRDTVVQLLQALGVRYVLLRRDLDTSFAGRVSAEPAVLAARLREVPALRRLRSFGVVDVYEAPSIRSAEVYAAVPFSERNVDARERGRLLATAYGAAGIPAGTALDGVASAHMRVVPVAAGAHTLTATADGDGTTVSLAPQSPRADAGRRVVRLPGVGRPFRLVAADLRLRMSDRPRTLVLPTAHGGHDAALTPAQDAAIGPDLLRSLGDCNRYDDRSLSDVGIAAQVDRSDVPTLRLRARDHAACVTVPVARAMQDGRLRLRLEYRGIRGEPPRICVWQDGPNRCATLPALDPSPGWHRLDVTVAPRGDAASTRLFLYADGADGRLTETAYRDLRVTPVGEPLALGVLPIGPLPEISYRRISPDELRVHVRGAKAPFLLVAAETFAPGWRLERTGVTDANVEHIRVNGYANGWRVPWRGSYELTVTYGPERLAQLARRIDLVAVPLGLLALILLPRRRR
jgi:arabinofuranan 3-O-arabinosyltransferase